MYMCTINEEEIGIVLYFHHQIDVHHVVHMLVHIQIILLKLHQQIQ
jgi:hypothetical protein